MQLRITSVMVNFNYKAQAMHIHTCTYIPAVTVTIPSVLVVDEVELNVHWKAVLWLIENTVNDIVLGLVGLFSWYNGLSTTFCWVNDVPLIIHVTGNEVADWYPQLMITLLLLHTVVFSGGCMIVTTRYTYIIHSYIL